MRGEVDKQSRLVLTTLSPEDRIPAQHPIRRIKVLADEALAALSPVFDEMYETTGRRSIPPERLLKASLAMALYSVRSERLFCEQLDYNLLFRWFLDMDLEEPSFDHSTFTRNRERLLSHAVAEQFFAAVVQQAKRARLISTEHFSVDGTLIEAWASLKSFRPKDEDPQDRPSSDDPGNPSVDFRGEKRSNETHESTTDPESTMARKSNGQTARLSFAQHVIIENRHGLLLATCISSTVGTSEAKEAAKLLDRIEYRQGATIAGDKAYDQRAFVDACRERGIIPHVAQNTKAPGGSRIDGRTTRHASYAASQRIRKRIEEVFGWQKTTGGFRRTRFKGTRRTQHASYLVGAAYNLVRMARLMPQLA